VGKNDISFYRLFAVAELDLAITVGLEVSRREKSSIARLRRAGSGKGFAPATQPVTSTDLTNTFVQ
jgi:hypothetical protein